jgi:WD40 repeat protein
VWGLDISPDDRTLYTAGLDGALLTWDLLGDRRWIRHLPLTAPLTHADQAVRGSPTGDAVVYISYADSIQFVDLATGRAGPMIDTGRYEFGNWAWRPDGSQLATAGAGTPEPALDRDRLPDRRSKPHRGRVARRASHPPVPGELPIAQRALNSDTWHGSDRRPARFT